jgi:hypothetical protein
MYTNLTSYAMSDDVLFQKILNIFVIFVNNSRRYLTLFINVWKVPEAAPQNVACSPLSSQSVKVSWSPPPADQHGGILQGYKVVYKPVLKDSSK